MCHLHFYIAHLDEESAAVKLVARAVGEEKLVTCISCCVELPVSYRSLCREH